MATVPRATKSEGVTAGSVPGRYRWRICALLLAATTINYVDRQVLGVLAPQLGTIIGWSERDYSYIVSSFQIAYAIGLVVAGAVIDKLGTRIGYALAIGVWSIAAMSHSLVSTVGGFIAVRFLLGLGEAGNFPSAIKTTAEWFPRKERSLATGIFNAGSNVGAVLAPLAVPIVAIRWGWQAAFLFTGVFSLLWIVAWLTIYRTPAEHPKLSPSELAYIQSDPPDPIVKIPWASLLPHRQTWAFLAAKFITDPVWWFLLSWLPKFLSTEYGLDLSTLGPPLIVVYILADVGSIAGGWLASRLLAKGWNVNRSRKTAMLVCALCVVPIMAAPWASNLWVAVGLVGLAAAAHQGWSANEFTMVSDMFPRRAVASVVGIGGFGGAVSGALFSNVIGRILDETGSYVPMFLFAGTAYLIALAVVHWIVPRMEPAKLQP